MMKGFKIDIKERRQRMAYQERQRIQTKVVKDPNNEHGIKLSEGQLKSFIGKLIK